MFMPATNEESLFAVASLSIHIDESNGGGGEGRGREGLTYSGLLLVSLPLLLQAMLPVGGFLLQLCQLL